MRRLYLSVLIAAFIFFPAAPTARSQEFKPGGLTVTDFRAPDLPPPGDQVSGTTWYNSTPLTMADLHGQVVLIDFWEYTCINCIRTFDDNKKWYERYHKYGFTIVGVHDPEFDVAYPVDNVLRAVKRFGLPYPIVVDDWFKIWTSYKSTTWPNRFLVDAKGVVRFNRQGEGADADFEHAIQYLLRESHPDLKFPDDYKIPPEKNRFSASCGIPTGEMYVGDWYNRGALSNAEGYRKGKTIDYKLPAQVADGHAAVSGRWETDKNGMIYQGKNKTDDPTNDKLVMHYHAREMYSVLNVSHGRPSRVYIQQDRKYLTEKDKGIDVQIDAQGRSYLEIREPRMYYLVSNPSYGQHEVSLFPTKSGLTVNSFVFGNNCQLDFSHL